jgi:hypothetical protein
MKRIVLLAMMLVGTVCSQAQGETRDTISNSPVQDPEYGRIERNYNYYNELYERYQKKAKVGKIYTLTGVGAAAIGSLLTYVGSENESVFATGTGIALLSYGFFSFNIGGALWVMNSIKADANRHEVDQIKRKYGYTPREISFGVTPNGVGIIVGL